MTQPIYTPVRCTAFTGACSMSDISDVKRYENRGEILPFVIFLREILLKPGFLNKNKSGQHYGFQLHDTCFKLFTPECSLSSCFFVSFGVVVASLGEEVFCVLLVRLFLWWLDRPTTYVNAYSRTLSFLGFVEGLSVSVSQYYVEVTNTGFYSTGECFWLKQSGGFPMNQFTSDSLILSKNNSGLLT